MWGKLLAGALTIGATAGVILALNSKAEEKKREYNSAVRSFNDTIHQSHRNLKHHLNHAQHQLQKTALKANYQQSRRLADEVYRFINDEKTAIHDLYSNIHALKAHRSNLFDAKKATNQKEEKRALQEEINLTTQTIHKFYEDLNEMKAKKEALYVELKALNHQVRLAKQQLENFFAPKASAFLYG